MVLKNLKSERDSGTNSEELREMLYVEEELQTGILQLKLVGYGGFI